ncbi:MAG: ABC transporter permease [Vicinamibacterales bacterium]
MSDWRFAVRMIAVHRWFSLAIIATLAVGIGVNATVFTLSSAVLFKPLPFQDGERVVVVGATDRLKNGRLGMSYPDVLDMRAAATTFEQLEAVTGGGGAAVLAESERPPERFRMVRVTAGFFHVFRTEAQLGRVLRPDDEALGAPMAVVISDDVWRNRYNSDPHTAGMTIRFNEQPATIVGVMPKGFRLPEAEDVWVPLRRSDKGLMDRTNRMLTVFGVLEPGVSIARAQNDLSVVAARLQTAYPDSNKDINAAVKTIHERYVGGKAKTMFSLMLGAVGLVLLIACANVANMMLSRAVGREREMTIRAALGATRWRVVRQLLVEGLILSVCGGVLALGVAAVAVPAFDRALVDAQKPSWIIFSLDYRVLAYTGALCILATVLFGLAPAIRASRVDLTQGLKEGGRGGSARVGWTSGALVVAQFAFAVVLLTASGLLIRSFMQGQHVNPWLPGASIMSAQVDLPRERYSDREARRRFFDEVQTRLAGLPGVVRGGLVSRLPGLGTSRTRIEIDGATTDQRDTRPSVLWVMASDSYFETVGLPIVRGRGFDARDGAPGGEAAVVSRTFAARHWPDSDAVGRRLRFNDDSPEPWMTVIGVTDDIVASVQEAAPEAVVFVPYRQQDPSSLVLAVRTAGGATSAAGLVRTTVQALDRDLPLYNVNTVDRLVYAERWPYRVFGTVFFVFAASALLMAAVGLYAVVSQSTGRRTREIGIRMAIGATPRHILIDVLRGGSIQIGIGLVLGVPAAFGLAGQMRNLLLGVVPTDPVVFLSTTSLLVTVGLVACWLPARRAARIEPVRALAEAERAR